MASLAEAYVDIRARVDGFQREVTTAVDRTMTEIEAEVKETATVIEQQFDEAADEITKATATIGDEFENQGKRTSAVMGAVQGAVAAAAGKIAKDSIRAASDLGESINAVNVVFGEAASGILALGENASTAVGLSQTEFNAFAVQFAGFTKQIAGAGGDIAAVTDDLTTRIADFASVMNLDIPEAAQVFQSSLAGETEPIRRFGIDLSAAAIELYALESGLIASASEMTESIKIQARFGLLMQETEKTAGDFLNTSDGLANSQRILTAQIKDAQATIGGALVPAIEGVLGVVLPLVEAFTALPEGLQQIIAVSALAGVGFASLSKSLQNLGLAAGTANRALGAIGLAITAAATIYSIYSGGKSEATAATYDFIDALRLEGAAQEDAIEVLALNNETVGASIRGLETLGLTVGDLETAVVSGNGPLADLLALTQESRFQYSASRDQLAILNDTINENGEFTEAQIADILTLTTQLGSLREVQLEQVDTINATTSVLAAEAEAIQLVTESTRVAGYEFQVTGEELQRYAAQVERRIELEQFATDTTYATAEAIITAGEMLGHTTDDTRGLIRQLGILDNLDVDLQIELGLLSDGEILIAQIDAIIESLEQLNRPFADLAETDYARSINTLASLRQQLLNLGPGAGRGGGGGGRGGGGSSIQEQLDEDAERAEADLRRWADSISSYANGLLTRDFADRIFEGTGESIQRSFRELVEGIRATGVGLQAPLDGLFRSLNNRFQRLSQLANIRDALKQQLEGIRQIQQQARDVVVLDLEQGDTSLREQIAQRVAEARDFASNLRALQGLGYPPAIIQEIIAAGLVGGAAMAKELATVDPADREAIIAGVRELERLQADIGAATGFALGEPEVVARLDQTNAEMRDLTNAIQIDLRDAFDRFLQGLNLGIDRLIDAEGVTTNLPGFASGGIVTRATLGVFGEAGPEALIPISRPARALQLLEESGLADLVRGSRGGAAVNIQHATFQDSTDADLVAQKVNAAYRARVLSA